MKHSKFSPSKLDRIIQCPGSVRLTENIQEISSASAEEGTRKHELVEKLINQEISHLEVLDEDVLYCYQVYSDLTKPGDNPKAEEQVSLSSLALEDVTGTADVVSDKVCIDWKFGYIPVDISTSQLKAYCLGAMLKRGLSSITGYIVQPKLVEPISFVKYSRVELEAWVQDILQPALEAGDALKAGEHCKWCGVRHTCSVRFELNLKKAKAIYSQYVEDEAFKDIPLKDLVMLYDLGLSLHVYIADIGKYLFIQLQQGKEVKNKKLVKGRAIRKWKDERETIEYLESIGVPLEDVSQLKILGPAKVEKMVTDRKALEAYIFKPKGKLKMADESDPRDEVSQNAETLFKKYV